jgi:hypothetical protein
MEGRNISDRGLAAVKEMQTVGVLSLQHRIPDNL